MQRSAAAIAEENKIARVEAMLDGDLPNRAGHDHRGNRDNAVSHLDCAALSGIAQMAWRHARCDRLFGGFDIERHFAAEKVAGVQAAKN